MSNIHAVIFDLGGTLVDWPDWDESAPDRWARSFDYLVDANPTKDWPLRDVYVQAMLDAERNHWRRVDEEHLSGAPTQVVREGFERLGETAEEALLLAALDGYGRAVDGWAVAFPDTRETLEELRQQGYRLGLLSNTWWAADWHNADLAAHGLYHLLDDVVYTSDLPFSKPHRFVFEEVTRRLGVDPSACVMVGDRLIDDVSGALGVGMRAVWKENDRPWPRPDHIRPTATVRTLAEIPPLLRGWNGR